MPNVVWLERAVVFECVFNDTNSQRQLSPAFPWTGSLLVFFSQSFKKHSSLWLSGSWSGEARNFLKIFWETILTVVLNVPRRGWHVLNFMSSAEPLISFKPFYTQFHFRWRYLWKDSVVNHSCFWELVYFGFFQSRKKLIGWVPIKE